MAPLTASVREWLFVCSEIVLPLENSNSDDDYVADYAHKIRNFAEEDKSPESSKYNLAIIKYRYFFGG